MLNRQMPFKLAMEQAKRVEGILAVNKPHSISSAQVIRDLQRHFTPSQFFAPWIQAERTRRARENATQRRRRRDKRPPDVKIGHGGTLDPLATGVLVMGIGKGTKHLQQFLDCTKTYETVVLFGVATDSYDRLGKVVGRAPYQHVTREKVEEALKQFRGSYMQLPPVFSSIRIQGKHLYEYARSGQEIPREIEKRPVTVSEMELLEWYEGGQHEYKSPTEEAPMDEKVVAEKVLHIKTDVAAESSTSQQTPMKRKRPARDDESESDDSDRELVFKSRNPYKKRHRGPEPLMSGGLGSSSSSQQQQSVGSTTTTNTPVNTPSAPNASAADANKDPTPPSSYPSDAPPPPAAKIRMTVSRGFYVRSLCHDLGQAVGSLGIMCELVRTRQGQFQLATHRHGHQIQNITQNTDTNEKSKSEDSGSGAAASKIENAPTNEQDEEDSNVFEYDDLAKGEAVWAPKVEKLLALWNKEYADHPPDVRVGAGAVSTSGDITQTKEEGRAAAEEEQVHAQTESPEEKREEEVMNSAAVEMNEKTEGEGEVEKEAPSSAS